MSKTDKLLASKNGVDIAVGTHAMTIKPQFRSLSALLDEINFRAKQAKMHAP